MCLNINAGGNDMKICPLPNQQFCNKPKDRMECEDCLLSTEELQSRIDKAKKSFKRSGKGE